MSDTSTVYIFTVLDAVPTYHDYGEIRRDDTGAAWDVTKCGMVMYDGETPRYGALLRRDHADSFARPCGKCFAGEVAGA